MSRLLIFILTMQISVLSSFVFAQAPSATTTSKPEDKTKKTEKEPEKKEPQKDETKKKLPSFGGKVTGTVKLYVESGDLMKFNSRYIGRVVHVYSYFQARPHELRLIFKDYKKNQVVLHMLRSNLYSLPNLYKDKLYEIRGKVGRIKDGMLNLQYVELSPMFLEKDFTDQVRSD